MASQHNKSNGLQLVDQHGFNTNFISNLAKFVFKARMDHPNLAPVRITTPGSDISVSESLVSMSEPLALAN